VGMAQFPSSKRDVDTLQGYRQPDAARRTVRDRDRGLLFAIARGLALLIRASGGRNRPLRTLINVTGRQVGKWGR
jgi:hypothetical protein